MLRLFIFLISLASQVAFAEDPSWFPQIACNEAWFQEQNNETRKAMYYRFHFEQFPKANYPQPEFGPQPRYLAYENQIRTHLTVARENCYKEWTVLVAMDAENDLMPYSLWDLYEMESAYSRNIAGSTLKRDLVVQHNGLNSTGLRRLHIFQTEREYTIRTKADFEQSSITAVESPVVEILNGAEHPNKLERFVNFLNWGMRKYPAKKYMVILWGHGKGWLRDDPNNIVHLRGPELAEALKTVVETTLENKRPIDNFIADACFMYGIELATEIAPYTRFISGSAQIQDFLGLPYNTLFYEMSSSYPRLRGDGSYERYRNDEPALVANLLPKLLRASLTAKGYQGRIDREQQAQQAGSEFFTYASVDSQQLIHTVVPGLERFASAVTAYINEIPDERTARAEGLARPILLARMFRSGIRTRELGSFIHAAGAVGETANSPAGANLKAAATAAEGALDQALISYAFATQYTGEGFRATGVWLPRSLSEFEEGIGSFSNTRFYSFGQWQRMLRAIVDNLSSL